MNDNSGWFDFLKLLLSAQEPQKLHELLELFLTPSEKHALIGRYQLIRQLLAEEHTQRQIAEELHLSISKITSGSNALKRISPELKSFLQDVILKEGK